MLNVSNLRRIWITAIVMTVAMLAFALASTQGSAHLAGSSKKSVKTPVSVVGQLHLKMPVLHLQDQIVQHRPERDVRVG